MESLGIISSLDRARRNAAKRHGSTGPAPNTEPPWGDSAQEQENAEECNSERGEAHEPSNKSDSGELNKQARRDEGATSPGVIL